MPGPSALGTRGAAAELARGREIFHSTEAGCSTCHGMDGQAPDGLRHAISETVEYDTPSLRFAGGTAPYFHDGRFGSLGDMLAATDGAMGKTHQLSPDDRRALETYLRSL
jgi:cytochrome c peroxidase